MKNPREQGPKQTDIVPVAKSTVPENPEDLNTLVPSFLSRLQTWGQACKNALPYHYDNYGIGIRGTFGIKKMKHGFQPAEPFDSSSPNFVCNVTYEFNQFGHGEIDISGNNLLFDPETGGRIIRLTVTLREASIMEKDPPSTKQLIVRETYSDSSKSSLSGKTTTQQVIYKLLPGEEEFVAERGEEPWDKAPDLTVDPMTDEHAKKLFDLVDLLLLGGDGKNIEKPKRRGLPAPQEE